MPATEASTIKPNPEQRMIRLPDMFVSFCARPPRVNPHCAKIGIESGDWIEAYVRRGNTNASTLTCQFMYLYSILGLDERDAEKHKMGEFSFLAGINAPDAVPEKLRCVCDWLTWVVFPNFDLAAPYVPGAH